MSSWVGMITVENAAKVLEQCTHPDTYLHPNDDTTDTPTINNFDIFIVLT